MPKFKDAAPILASAVLIAGCASSPDKIDAQYVTEAQFSGYNCKQIADELQRIGRRVSELTDSQEEAATADAVTVGVGLVLFWPALFVLAATDDHEAELGRLKGEYEALHRVALKKNCSDASARAQASGVPAAVAVESLTTEASKTELAFWQAIEHSDNPEFFESYLRQYPDGPFVPLAREKLIRLGGSPDELQHLSALTSSPSPYVDQRGQLIEAGFRSLTSDRSFKKRLQAFYDAANVKRGRYQQSSEMEEVIKVTLASVGDGDATFKVKFRWKTDLEGRIETGHFRVAPNGTTYTIIDFLGEDGVLYTENSAIN